MYICFYDLRLDFIPISTVNIPQEAGLLVNIG